MTTQDMLGRMGAITDRLAELGGPEARTLVRELDALSAQAEVEAEDRVLAIAARACLKTDLPSVFEIIWRDKAQADGSTATLSEAWQFLAEAAFARGQA